MSTDNEYNKLLIVGSLIGLIGAIGLIVGMILQFNVFVNIDVFVLTMMTIALGIAIVCLLTFIGALTPDGLYINDERPGVIFLFLFIFAPTSLFSNQTTPLYYIMGMCNQLLDEGATLGFAFYMLLIGAALMLISFCIFVWIFLWKGRINPSGANLGESSTIGLIKISRIVINILAIVGCVGIILGFILPGYTSAGTVSGLLMYEDGSHLDLGALTFLILILGGILTAVLSLLANFGMKFGSKSELPLLAYLSLILILPGYTLKSTVLGFWSSSFYELLQFGGIIFGDAAKTITFGGWLLLLSAMGLMLVLFLSIMNYFFGQSAKMTAKVSKRGGLEGRRQKGKFPTGPPSASGPPAAEPGLGAQLSAQSGPPTGPPSASGGPPSTASFMPTAPAASGSPSASEVPTCPFCGKQLRFIDEYQRWYCDSCSQYV